ANKPSTGIAATVIGLVTLASGAAGVMGELKSSLNTIWEVQPKPGGGIMGVVKGKAVSFGVVLGTGFLLLVSLVLSAALAAIVAFFQGLLPVPPVLVHVLDFALSAVVVTLLFALTYKVLPDAAIEWRDVWIGAGVTALLFSIGKIAIGLYL